MELLYRDEVYAIIGAAMEVHRELGSGFYEAVYQEATQIELGLRNVPFEHLKRLPVRYKGILLEKEYIADLICFGSIIVELKAIEALTSKDESQVLNYLKATGMRVAILINFGNPNALEWKRFVR
ncbi:MAG TPA: GxxExxY protein [Tepidisphaeraceae bacterium]|jgi:GxxExxY protein|nr:GxxExxY protein [Tepidisphaeraceae bacterium]